MEEHFEAVIIGSGFGGAITGCRLAKKWPDRVLILERGKRYPMGSFARSPHDISRAFWVRDAETTPRPGAVRNLRKRHGEDCHGLFDVRNYERMDVVLGAGLGGGSLIYANVFMVPPEQVFDDRWPSSCKRPKLSPYYSIAKDVLGSRPIPTNIGEPRREIIRTKLFQEVAKKNGRNSELADINVFFGNNFSSPTPIGLQEKNRYGAIQTSCVYCAECDIGCNYHAKNTLDLNYLFVAERRYGAQIRTEHLATRIVPVDSGGGDDRTASGEHGYRVYCRNLTSKDSAERAVYAKRVIVSAGTLGSTELLLRCRQYFKTLPRVSDSLGQSFSGNGDFLTLALDTKERVDATYGPVITQRTDYNLFQNFERERAFILEDASYGTTLAWFADSFEPRFGVVLRLFRNWVWRTLTRKRLRSVGWMLENFLRGDPSYHACVMLCMGLDKSDGVMSLDGNLDLGIDWPQKSSRSLYNAIVEECSGFASKIGARHFLALPDWGLPFRKNITVHSLGGCVLADDAKGGVTSADPRTFGQVFGYENLFIADGSIVPTAVGANPTATISALSEMVAEGITGIAPDANL